MNHLRSTPFIIYLSKNMNLSIFVINMAILLTEEIIKALKSVLF